MMPLSRCVSETVRSLVVLVLALVTAILLQHDAVLRSIYNRLNLQQTPTNRQQTPKSFRTTTPGTATTS